MASVLVGFVALLAVVLTIPWLLANLSAEWLVVVVVVAACGLVGHYLRRHGA